MGTMRSSVPLGPERPPTYEATQRQRQSDGQQLDMIRPLRQVIDETHKIDSSHHPDALGDTWTPKDQWERPGPSGFSLRDVKKAEAGTGMLGNRLIDAVARDKVGPVTLYKDPYTWQDTVADGHHRLASHEALGHAEIPVQHRQKRSWGSS